MRHEPARAMRESSEDAQSSVTRVTGKVDAVSGWARRLTAELESVLLDTLGLAATIEWHLHRWQKGTGIACGLAVSNAAGFDLPEEYAASIFHIYNEALSNVVRHARAGRVAVALTITPHKVTLVVRDYGIGLGQQVSSSGRGGIAGMRTRAQSHKGLCEFTGAASAGTTVTANLPIAQAS
jgi:signal transduction histidine kinase